MEDWEFGFQARYIEYRKHAKPKREQRDSLTCTPTNSLLCSDVCLYVPSVDQSEMKDDNGLLPQTMRVDMIVHE